jgi:phage-related minor tail protein
MGSNFERIGKSIASGVSDNLTAAIMQTKTLGDAAKSILNDLANTLVRLGVNTILGGIAPGIFGGLPMLNFANGGRPPTGRASLVGEKGPELFVPKRSGTIIPNDKLGGGSTNINVNIDASGSSVQGDAQQSKELGRAISAAIQSELLKQKRPGGLLT